MTPPPSPEKTEGLTYTYGKPAVGEPASARRFEIGLSVLLAILLGVLWIVFRRERQGWGRLEEVGEVGGGLCPCWRRHASPPPPQPAQPPPTSTDLRFTT